MEKLTFPEACGLVYSKGLKPDYEREIKEDVYLSSVSFGGSYAARMKAMSFNAEIRVDQFKQYCAVLDGERRKGHYVKEKKEALIKTMPAEDVELAEIGVYGFWNN